MERVCLVLFLLNFQITVSVANDQPKAKVIVGIIDNASDGDGLMLTVYKFSSAFPIPDDQHIYCKIRNHRFKFTIPNVDSVGQCDISFLIGKPGPNRNLSGYSFLRDPIVEIHFSKNGIKFLGKSKKYFATVYGVNKIFQDYSQEFKPDLEDVYSEVIARLKFQDFIFTKITKYLTSNPYGLPKNEIYKIKDELDIKGEIFKTRLIAAYFNNSIFKKSVQNNFGRVLSNPELRVVLGEYLHPIDLTRQKEEFLQPDLIYARLMLDSSVVPSHEMTLLNCFRYIVNSFNDSLRDQLLMRLIYYNRSSNKNRFVVDGEIVKNLIDSSLAIIKEEKITNFISRIKKTATVGASVFNFSFIDTSGKEWSYDDFKGKPLLIDVWYTGCGNCVKILPYMNEMEKKFLSKGIIFLSVSLDKDFKTWCKSVFSAKYTTLGSIKFITKKDNGKDPFLENYDLYTCPSLLAIDRNGKFLLPPLDPRYDNGEDLKKVLKQLLE